MKRPNRLQLSVVDGAIIEPVLSSDASESNGKISWAKPNDTFIPTLVDSSGSNYHERKAQLFHMIFTGGAIYEVNTLQTIILEIGAMTELTEDQFYDNGNLASNLAALLNINPSQIRIMNVISESSQARRRRRAAQGTVSNEKIIF